MKKPFLNYIQVASDIRNAPIAVRGRILAVAVGMSLGCRLPLPASVVADPHEYYTSHVERPVSRIVSDFNEQTILDVKYAAAMARNFWMMRYDAAHGCPRLGISEGLCSSISEGFFMSMFSVNSYFSVNEVEFLNEQHVNIANVYNVCCQLVADMLETTS